MTLTCEQLRFKYPTSPLILNGVNIKIDSGEVVGIVAPSGCGKTTLAKIMAGHLKPTGGAIHIDGQPIDHKAYNPIQLVFQHPEKAINPRWKMQQMMNEAWQVSDEVMEDLGIKQAWLNRWPNELSGGELQRFCLARALSPQTAFLIADEITTMLDSISQAQIWRVIMKIVEKQNLAVAVISHDHTLANQICSRHIHL